MVEVRWGQIVKTTFIHTVILIIINLVLAAYLTENVERYINNGILDSLDVHYSQDGDLVVQEDGVDISVYQSYEEALIWGSDNRFLIAQNGLTYKKTTPFGKNTYILDFTWLPKGVYDLQDIKDYLRDYKVSQIIRTSYISSGLLVYVYVFPLLLIIGYYLLPIILVIISKLYVDLRISYSNEDELSHVQKVRRLTQSQFLDRLFQRYERGKDIQIITSIYSMMLVMNLGVVGQLTVDVGSMVMGYIGILIVLGMYYTGVEYQRLDAKRYLEQETEVQEVLEEQEDSSTEDKEGS